MAKVFLRAQHGYDVMAASDESALRCEDVSLAKQSDKDECDINTIVERFGLGYQMPEGLVAPVFGDFTDVHDFQSAMNAIATARESFDALHAGVRARFQNDPQRFVEFCSEEENRAELERLGLAIPRPVAASGAAPEVAPAPAASSAPAAASAGPGPVIT